MPEQRGFFDRWKNKDGKYDGVAMMSELTGMSREEVLWHWGQLSMLVKSGMDKNEAISLVKERAKQQPWKQNPT